ncbi:maleylpyruvate isomerase family mycothiol-dependent enzyme [Streptomyces sp. ACA25]|uniref:maleylpyruvate isomerase family mycothiol-dependent enzyme n=1 Tax=Streptomyces sp. ACA25 TaxID=3022596 RepID=UPI002308080F|nr:maleylpyruvate isomerase family mycothiol-dependent enzyme [Streptomyces sp. ACA25]MDB1086870.1 maleylpyruvate isomerase family mycothiol-dependent enzyme [Streptomyces sp. ACA25]
MRPLDHDRYCTEVVTQTRQFAAQLSTAQLSLPVPACPGWTLADLGRHVGGNLRTVGTAVLTGRPVDDTGSQVPGASGPADNDPVAMEAWLLTEADRFASAMLAAGPAAEVQVWGIEGTTAFWARRAAHDVVVHRADVAAALGSAYHVAPDMAADAIDELLELFEGEDVELGPAGRSIHLHATDTGGTEERAAEWFIELDDEGFGWRRAHGRATVTLRGPLSDLLRVFHRRLPPRSEGLEVLGETALLDRWLQQVALR